MRVRTAETLQRRAADADALARGRAAAEQLAMCSPGWWLMYGPASRQIWAFAAWTHAPALALSSTDPARLAAAMRQAEQEHRAPSWVGGPSPIDRRGGAAVPPSPRRHGYHSSAACPSSLVHPSTPGRES